MLQYSKDGSDLLQSANMFIICAEMKQFSTNVVLQNNFIYHFTLI